MKTIVDVDTHSIEPASVFDYLSEAEQPFRPSILRKEVGATIQTHFSGPNTREYWVIDNALYGKHDAELISSVSNGEFTTGAITLDDVPSRLAAMDRQGVDAHVMFSSLFLNVRCHRPAAELALTRAFNRWIAERSQAAKGRLRWLFVPSLKNPEATAKEMDWARANGAVGLYMRGLEGDRFLDHPDFDPVYRKCVELDWPVCVHIGHGSPAMETIGQREGASFNRFISDSPNYYAFSVLLNSKLIESFPTLRFGFFESGCTWVPAAVQTALHTRLRPEDLMALTREKLERHNFWFTCEMHEDLPHLLRYIGEERLMGCSDFGHPHDIGDTINYVERYAAREDIPVRARERIIRDNAHGFFRM
jgi:predicted TIM-barrel fold metal-dependent hydrolase